MSFKLWRYFLVLPLTSLTASPINAQGQANLVLGLRGSDASVRTCSKSLQNCLISVSEPPVSCLSQPGTITITNNSRIVAKNIKAYSTNSNFINYVVANNSCPTNLNPNNSCTISFTTNTSISFLINNIIVKGTNTRSTFFDMQAIPCSTGTTTTIATDTNTLNNVTCDPPVTINVTNTGSVAALGLNFTVDDTYTTCTTTSCLPSLAPGESCEFSCTTTFDMSEGTSTGVISGNNTNSIPITLNLVGC
ncbi:hypothetical protein ACD661_12500 [Legionella lytica]|uniref:Transmembrane protein n=1 Tax=Legionella lytica TaxID=96232 RepID=A0ABW8D9L0_9GAMM